MFAAVSASAAMIAAYMALTVVMIVMIAVYIGVKLQFTLQESCDRIVCISGNTAIQLDPSSCKGCLRAAANTAANQNVCIERMQDASQCAVSAAVRINDFRSGDSSILSIIDLKLCRMAKMLEDLAILISNCDSHNMFSFWFFILLVVKLLETAVISTIHALPITQHKIAAFDPKGTPIHDASGQFLSCALIDPLDRGPCDLHKSRALFLAETFLIDQADRFIFIDRHDHRLLFRRCVERNKRKRLRKMTDFSALHWPGHAYHSFCDSLLFIITEFWAYVNIISDICPK